ncbi:MAG: hypothetical protein GY896_08890 [Gammaproteobacteria bacterium]|nr:hypothetical protein [Gammaproteobacteria bacterium]MCP4979204.1 hypothetical protein [Gammaproteobacteria bacterium]
MIPEVKERLMKVVKDPHFSRRERHLAKSSLQRIDELELQVNDHWTEMARMELLTEVQEKAISKQAAIEVDSFLKRHRRRSKPGTKDQR